MQTDVGGRVMITKDKVAKVTDFGLVKVFEDAYSRENQDRSFQELKLIKTGSAIGTPPYMSPEQFKDTKLELCSMKC